MGVQILGVGLCGSFRTSSGMSYRELTAQAARMAYKDAGISTEDLDGAVVAEEDFTSGYSICDEYTPDQLGVVRKAVYTVCGDFLQALGSAVMQIETGQYRLLAVSAFSKASNVLTKDEVLNFAYDPTLGRLGVTPHYLAGIEAQALLETSGLSSSELAEVAVQAADRATLNPLCAYGMNIDAEQVLRSRTMASPLTELMAAIPADGAVVAVVASDEIAADAEHPVCIDGISWASGTVAPENRNHSRSVGTELAAEAALADAGLASAADADVVYVSDLYAHRYIMHLDALDLVSEDCPPVNPDGGSLGMGDLYEGNGGARLYDAVQQVRGTAGAHQVSGAKRAVIQSWRGLPTDSCAVVVLSEGRNA